MLCKSGVNRTYLSVTKVEPIKSQFGTVMPDPVRKKDLLDDLFVYFLIIILTLVWFQQ